MLRCSLFNHLHQSVYASFADPAVRSAEERYMQHARFKPHAKERTCNPVQRPDFRGRAAGDVEVTRAEGGTPLI